MSERFCQCGCGAVVKAEFKHGHNRRIPHPRWMRRHGKVAHLSYEIEDRGHVTPCWIWQGRSLSKGYGRIEVQGKRMRAHRFAYELLVGDIPDDMDTHHECEVRLCVNPDHLRLVTRQLHAQLGGQAVLKPWQVLAMRRAREECDFTISELAQAFGVSYWCARNVIRGRTWRTVEAA